ncbi:MAG: hypothetical protein HZB49_17150 [Bradyrhizobium sp.]|nr:hypothetical protein [Bradyrhizobium sp.]
MNSTFTRNARIVLAAGFGLASAAVVWTVTAEEDTSATSLAPRAPATPISTTPPKKLASNFEAIVARPLFLETRRPIPPKPAPAVSSSQPEAIATPPLAATLLGVIVSPNVKSAVVRLASGKSVTVAEGETIEGWKLKRVTPESVRFERNTAVAELTFPVRQASSGRASPASVPGALVRRRQ